MLAAAGSWGQKDGTGRGPGALAAGGGHAHRTVLQHGAALGNHSQVPCPGDGLGTVGGPELAQEMADMFLDGVEGDHQFAGDALVGFARRQQQQDLQLPVGQLLDQAWHGRAATTWRQNRAGSLSAVSADSHATGRLPDRAQWASRAVLPNPAGAHTRVSRRASPSSSAAVRRGAAGDSAIGDLSLSPASGPPVGLWT